MNNKLVTCAVLLIPSLSSGLALAAASDLLDESDFLIDIPEVTSATRLPQKLSESPASITIIDRTLIDASGLQTLPDLLRLVPGFQSYLISSNKFGVAYHGVSDDFPNRLEVMVDGRSVYLPLLSTVDWTSLGIHLSDVARIEVVRGSNVPTQGSNAFIGSINIITVEPTASSGLTLETLLGGQNTRNAHLSYADSNSLFSYRLSASHEQNDGNDHYSSFYTGPYFSADSGEWQDDLERNYLNLSATWTPNLNNSLWLQLGVDRGQETVGALDKEDAHFADREHASYFQNLKFSHLYSATGTLQLSAYYNHLDLSIPNASVAEVSTLLADGLSILPPMSPATQQAFVQSLIDLNSLKLISEAGTMDTFDSELQISDRLGRLTFVTGLGYRFDQAESDILLQGGAVDEYRSRIFGTLNYDLTPRLQLTTGAMFEHSSADLTALSYRHALIFKPDPTSSIRLGYSRSERLPSLLDRNLENNLLLPPIPGYSSEPLVYDRAIGPNEDLDPEQISSWELGFYHILGTPNSYIDLRLFHERVEDAIFTYWYPESDELASEQRIGRRANIGAWSNDGFEFQFKHQPLRDVWYLLNYAYINTVNEEWERGVNKGTFHADPSMTPAHTASLLLSWSPMDDLDLSLAHYYMSDVDWNEGGFREDYNRTDLRLARRWNLAPRTELETALIVQNAFGPSYPEFYQYNWFDRRTYLQLTLKCP